MARGCGVACVVGMHGVQTGSGNFTMRLRVNGADVFARGANLIPMEELEGRASATAIATMVASAADANMNMLRVWGGGIFQYNQFYGEACCCVGRCRRRY